MFLPYNKQSSVFVFFDAWTLRMDYSRFLMCLSVFSTGSAANVLMFTVDTSCLCRVVITFLH